MAQKRKRQSPVSLPKGRDLVYKEAALRTVRPRPLHYDEKLRVLWPDNPELEKIDGGAFANWLKESEAARERGDLNAVGSCQAQVVIVGNANNPTNALRKAAERALPAVPLGTASMLAQRLEGRTIKVPKFRLLPRSEWPPEPAGGDSGEVPLKREEVAYIRHRAQDEADLKVEYDLDSDDERWLSKRNTKGGGHQLTADDLELLIDGFEKAKHAILGQQQSAWDRRSNHGRVSLPEERAPAEIYPVSQAIRDFDEEFPSLTIRAVHNHWVKKAAASKLPLLQRFWYDKPWARAVARNTREELESDTESDGGVPFQGKDTPGPRRARNRILDLDEVEDRLHASRNDLESLRTIVDQVRKREKMKKRQLFEWRREWRERVFMAHHRKAKVQKKPGKAVEAIKAKAAAQKKAASGSKPETKTAKAKVKKQARGGKAAGKKPGLPPSEQPVTSGRSLGGGLVSAVVGQLRRLGSWGTRGGDSPKANSRSLQAQDPSPRPKKRRQEGVALPVSAPLTRQQEQAEVEAAVQLSLQEERKSGAELKQVTRKRVRFVEAQPGQALQQKKELATPDSTLPKRSRTEATLQAASAERRTRQQEKNRVACAHGTGDEDRLEQGHGLHGVVRDIRCSPGKARGALRWTAECKHGTFEITRAAQLLPFFREHGGCRPAWKRFLQQAGEPKAAYSARLKEAFPLANSRPEGSPLQGKAPWAGSLAQQTRLQASKKAAGKAQSRQPVKPAGVQRGKGKRSQVRQEAIIPTGEGAGDSVLEAAHRQSAAGKQTTLRSVGPAEAEELERRPARRTTRNAAGREQGKGKPSRPDLRPVEVAPEPGGADGNAPDGTFEASPSSSGSDTYVSPASDAQDSDYEEQQPLPQPPSGHRRTGNGVRLTRRTGGPMSRLHLILPKVPLEWKGRALEAASDESSFSEGSGPSLFIRPRESGTVSCKPSGQPPLHREYMQARLSVSGWAGYLGSPCHIFPLQMGGKQLRGAARKPPDVLRKRKGFLVAAARQRAKWAAEKR